MLSTGGLGFPEPTQARAVNAALQALAKTNAIKVGRRKAHSVAVYAYNVDTDDTSADDEEADPLDLPF